MRLLNFLKDNHSLVTSYHSQWYKKEIALCKDARSKIIILFINALNASNSGGNLDDKGKSIEKLSKDITGLKGDKLSFLSFTTTFLDKPYKTVSQEAIDFLFNKLIEYEQIGHKKAALFLRDMLYTGAEDIFIDVVPSVIWPMLVVPVDKVIGELLSLYFRVNKKNNDWNGFLREKYADNHMYYEDLWFWGHFGTKSIKQKRYVEENGNEAMFLMDTIMTTMQIQYIADVKKQIKTFVEIFQSKEKL